VRHDFGSSGSTGESLRLFLYPEGRLQIATLTNIPLTLVPTLSPHFTCNLCSRGLGGWNLSQQSAAAICPVKTIHILSLFTQVWQEIFRNPFKDLTSSVLGCLHFISADWMKQRTKKRQTVLTG